MPEESFELPAESAKQAKLLLPQVYDPYQNEGDPRLCYIKYDVEHRSLVVMTEDTEEVMDILAIDDVIGASVKVELHDDDDKKSSNEPRVASTPIGDVDNAPKSLIPSDTQAAAKLTIFVYPRKDPSKDSIVTSCTGKKQKVEPVKEFNAEPSKKLLHRYAHHRTFQVAPAEDFAHLSVLVKAIRKLARPEASSSSERLLVIVNPFSGRQKGAEIYTSVVAPMLEQAGIDHDHIITTHAGHAQELMAPKEDANGNPGDITKYDGLVAIGGDGIIYEIMQGIKQRPDSDTVWKNLKLGHIGAGTSNGLSASLAYASQERFSATDYAFIVAKGKTVPMDLSRYETKSSDYISFLTFSWSLIADIDIESEVLRWMGWLRMEVYSAWRVINLRSYRAKLSYLPPAAKKLDALPPLSKALTKDDGWVTIEDSFCLFWVSLVTHAGEEMLNHPMCKLDDGLFHIFLVRNNVSRLRMLLILLGFETGSHVNMDGVEFIDCTAYRLEPISKGSYNDLDGEVIESGPVQGMVLRGAIQAYCNL